MGNLWGGVSLKEPSTLEECDSTWETDSGSEEEEEEEKQGCGGRQQQQDHPQGRKQEEKEEGGEQEDGGAQQSDITTEQIVKPKRSFYAARDLYKYRHQYPQNFKDLRGQNDLCNLRFYLNKIPLKPDGVYIEDILSKWKGDYDKLEHNHTYIQWLFPLREQGLNFYAKELTTFEIEEFRKTKEAIKKFLLAYRMMLEFFGIKLIDKTGSVTRATNWQERFQHLNESQHNYLRITRILKSLGELGYESFKSPLVKIFLQEALVAKTIPNIKQSALEYFVYTIRDRRERRKLLRFARRHYHPPEHFIWGPQSKEKFEESKPLLKPGSPCAPKCRIQVSKKSKDAKCIPMTGSPRGKTSCQTGTNNEVINDSASVDTNLEVATQNIDKKKEETKNQNWKSEEAKDSLDDTENISQAEKSEHALETVNQERQSPQTIDSNISVKDSSFHLTVDLSVEVEADQPSELVPEDQKNS